MRIVAIGGADKSRLLERWAGNGHATSAMSLDALAQRSEPIGADVVLLDLQGSEPNADPALAKHFAGTTVIDCSNVRDVTELRSGSGSVAERLAKAYPNAKVVKALNHLTAAAIEHVMSHSGARGSEGYISGYYCGDDDEARRTAAALIDELHLHPSDCGPLANATLIEAIGLLTARIATHAPFGPYFAISVIREHGETSPLDSWM